MYHFIVSPTYIILFKLHSIPNEETKHQKSSVLEIKVKGPSSDRDQVSLLLNHLNLPPNQYER